MNEADAGHDSIGEEQAVADLLQGDEGSAMDHGDAGEEFKQDSVEVVGGSEMSRNVSIVYSRHCLGPLLTVHVSWQFSNSSDATLVDTDAGLDRMGKVRVLVVSSSGMLISRLADCRPWRRK